MARPSVIAPLFSRAAELKGIGKQLDSALSRLLGKAEVRLIDVLFHLPTSLIDRRFSPPLTAVPDGVVATFEVMVESHLPPAYKRGNLPFRVICSNASGVLHLSFFHARKEYIEKQLPIGETRIISGRVERYHGHAQIVHPDYIVPVEEKWKVAKAEAIYPLVAGLTNRQMGWIASEAVKQAPELPEWLDAAMLRQKGWGGWKQAITAVHKPVSEEDVISGKARERLAYDELLASQLALMLARARYRKQAGLVVKTAGNVQTKMEAALPFRLTDGQRNVLGEIATDMASGARMLRLLQGDVGSGKTVVAMLAMADIIEMGKQAALMAPTDILARQHAALFKRILEPLGIRVMLLTGKVGTPKEREAMRAQVAAGEVDVVIGTHALFQESVAFKDLALVVVDEQHRFGVTQRMQLAEKAIIPPHILLMTATPIPRTLTMAMYGDMESSILREKPAGRQKVETRALPLERVPDVVEALKRAIADGNKVYWICPLVEEMEEEIGSEKEDIAAAEMRFKTLQSVFGNRVGLVHGRIKPDAREPIMAGFAGDEYDILVATTVVEVGVDVPSATVMVIEHAERFGLSQLHQLRGRVGRGSKASSCILLYRNPAGEVGEQRLRIMRETEDGFRIAEEDMRLRGVGDVLGKRQSGMQSFRIADLARDGELLSAARDDAKYIIHQDAELQSERGKALRTLLYLFSYDENIRLIHSG
ncbi:MAG: ATP-dependent DNA helicase RecG [Alphaproteobacteria bacterium]|nr:ATP-dependent DNA helicase RecG [Alphaproteobacteria bacterium]